MEQSLYDSEKYNNNNNSPSRSISDLTYSPCLNCLSFKKRSPPSDLPLPQPKKIKEYRVPENPYGVSPINVVKLQPDSVSDTSPFLRRCYSDPYNNPVDSFMNPYDDSDPNNPVLRRTNSDPIPPNYLNSADGRSLSRCTSGLGTIKEESPNSKRLSRMKDRMREMNRWLGEVIRQDKDDDPEDENVIIQGANLENGEADEEVSVERVGECLSINFKCPCSKVCQILLSGKHCYFKMI